MGNINQMIIEKKEQEKRLKRFKGYTLGLKKLSENQKKKKEGNK